MIGAFQDNAFQNNAFQVGTNITSTEVMQLPVNCVLAEDALFRERIRTFERMPGRGGTRVRARKSRVMSLGAKSTFTVKTSKRGFD